MLTKVSFSMINGDVLNVLDYGADNTGTSDSTTAIQAAINAAIAQNKTLYVPNGTYLISSSTTTFDLPYDDGTVYPGWVGSGDVNIAAEAVVTMPVCLYISGNVSIVGESREGVIFQGGYNVTTGTIDTTQKIAVKIGASIVGSTQTTLENITFKNFFIGGVGVGLTYRSTFFNLQFNDVVLPWNCQASDGNTTWRKIVMARCYGGITVGGRWYFRDKTSFETAYIPPYPAVDIQRVGWCDNTFFDEIEWGTGFTYNTRAQNVDAFFDTYFYKSANSATYPTGRASVNTSPYWDGFGTYRGIVGFPVNIMSRYGRYSFNVQATRFITNFHQRSAIYFERLSRGFVGYFYNERIGYVDPATATGVFGVDVPDPYHAGQPQGSGIWINNGDVANMYGNMVPLSPAGSLTSGLENLTTDYRSIVQCRQGLAFGNAGTAGTITKIMQAYDYGQWTPVDNSGASLSFTGQFSYSKIGNLVTLIFTITFPSTANSADTLIAGIPYGYVGGAGGNGWALAYTSNSVNVGAKIVDNTTTFRFVNSLTGANLTNAQMSGATVRGTLTYFIT